jgi:uncharacterized protein YutE (UPF0331/DUF86 family)
MNDILLNKAAIIERCLKRVKEEYENCPQLDNYTHLDAIILNLERTSQATIDMAMHIVAKDHLGVPQSSADGFELIYKAGKIDANLLKALKGMVGFRNIAVYEYQSIDLNVLRKIITDGKKDLVRFCSQLGIKIKV